MTIQQFFHLALSKALGERMNHTDIICNFEFSSHSNKAQAWVCFYTNDGNFSAKHESPETAIEIACEDWRNKLNPDKNQLTYK